MSIYFSEVVSPIYFTHHYHSISLHAVDAQVHLQFRQEKKKNIRVKAPLLLTALE